LVDAKLRGDEMLDHLDAQNHVERFIRERQPLQVCWDELRRATFPCDRLGRGLEDPARDVAAGESLGCSRQAGDRCQESPIATPRVKEISSGKLLGHQRHNAGELPIDGRIGKANRRGVAQPGSPVVYLL